MMKTLFALILLTLFSACNKSGGEGFKGLDSNTDGNSDTPSNPVAITSFFPETDPVVLTNATSQLFGVTVGTDSGDVTYEFIKDNSLSIQTGTDPFYLLYGSSLNTENNGNHTLKVIAKNSSSQEEKVFNVRKNTPTAIANPTPSTSGTTINCGATSLDFSAVLADVNQDNFVSTWYLDTQLVTPSTPFASVLNPFPGFTKLTYTPECSTAGSHVLQLRVFDGYEYSETTWSFTVTNPPPPPGSVHISSFTPSTSPVVLTNSTNVTFGVTVADGAGSVNYDFIKDMDEANPLQTGGTSFYNLSGASLTPGSHSLKITASNGTSHDDKIFSIRKNTAPFVQNFTPTLNGGSLNCSSGSQVIDVTVADNDLDPISVKWKVDNVLATNTTPFVSTARTENNISLTYTPDCTKTGVHSFQLILSDGYEETTQTWSVTVNNPPAPPGAVQIISFTPTVTPVVMIANSNTTFGVTVADGAGSVNYTYTIDSNINLSSGPTSFYNLSSVGLTAGAHLLKVVASNGTTQAEKIFNVRKNTPPSVTYYSPALTGATINCGTGSQQLLANIADVDNDAINIKWKIDNSVVTSSTPFTTLANSSGVAGVSYAPDCTKNGVHIIELTLNDGYEEYTQSWTVYVNNPPPPPGDVRISSFTPTTNPTVVTNSSNVTLGVSVADGAGTVTYNFTLDGQSPALQAGSTTFYNLSGSAITPGTHTVRALATNGITSDEKNFTIRKNTKPNISFYSPSLNGGSLNCSGGSQTLLANIGDLDQDTISVKWKVDSDNVTTSTPFVATNTTTSSTSLTYTPDCTKAGVHTFQLTLSDGYEEYSQTWNVTVNNPPAPPGTVQILSFTPTVAPIVLTKDSTVTFGVSVPDGVGSVSYVYILDNQTPALQSSTASFYNLAANSLTAGAHSVKVTASNGVTSDEKIFSLRKNTPPNISYYTPSLTGGTFNCTSGTQRIDANIGDIDNDNVSVQWKLDNATVTNLTQFVSTTNSAGAVSLTYAPDCTKTGLHLIELILTDGYEQFSQTWTVTVNNPPPAPGAVRILTYTPTNTPSIITNNTNLTFGITVAEGSGTVNYGFVLDGTTTLQTGAATFYTLSGLGLSTGSHSLKVTASNGITSDEKTFSIRKNTPPSLSFYTPALTGSTVGCTANQYKKIEANLIDIDGDSMVTSWKIDDVAVTPTTSFTSTTSSSNYASLTYTPDCTTVGPHKFELITTDGYETFTQAWVITVSSPPTPPGDVQILSVSPTVSSLVMTNSSSATFGITVAEGSGTVFYDFIEDNSITRQTGTIPYYGLNGSTLQAGPHTIKVVARNSTSQDTRTFNVRKNTPPNFSGNSPTLTGTSFNCTGGSTTLLTTVGDSDGDSPLTVKWKIDDALVTGSTSFATVSRTGDQAQLIYAPDCTKVGTHNIQILVSDGYEETNQIWTVVVNNPPATINNVVISNFTPTASTTIMTATSVTTFAVSIQDGAGVVTYEFKLDDVVVGTPGTTPYLIINGVDLTEGTHVLRVKASNSVSYAEKSFNIRRNALPVFSASSPAPTGQSVNCGSSITFDGTVVDSDTGTTLTKSWLFDNVAVTNSATYTITENPNYSKMVYLADCNKTGVHTMNMKVFDGYEYSNFTWSFTVNNPAQETLGATTPTGSNIVVLSTEANKTFTAIAQTGIPPYTFIWKIKRTGVSDVIKLTESNVTSSSLILSSVSDLVFGNQTVEVTLTDSTTANNPASPATRSWTVYRNQKPQIASLSPGTSKKINSNTTQGLTAAISDADDTFTTSITRGASLCSPASSCGLSSVVTPTSTGTFSANFKSGTTFIGDNSFTLTVTDSNGESSTAQFNINANYFSDVCNNLSSGQICTLAGMPGLGEDLNITVSDNLSRVRIHPSSISWHNVGLTNKNMIFTDTSLHTVWYWNRNSTSIQLGPYTIAANSAKAIIGSPNFPATVSAVAANFGNLSTTQLRNFFLYQINPATQNVFVSGISLSSTGSGASMVTNVYISEYNSARVLRLQFNNSTSTANVQPSSTLTCNPTGLALDTVSSPNLLYIACYAQHQIKTISNPGAASAFGVTGATAPVNLMTFTSTSVDGAVPGTATVIRPSAMYFDPVDKLLYFTEQQSPYKFRVYNPNASSVNLFDTSVAASSIKTLVGTSTANSTTYGLYSATLLGNPLGVIPYRLGGTLRGFFISDYNRVIFVNNTNASITIGNNTIAAYSSGVAFGFNNIAGATNNNGTLLGGKSSPLNNPVGIEIDGDSLFVSDYNNTRIRRLVINDGTNIIANGTVSNALGSIPKAGYNESPTLQAQQAQFRSPQALKFDSTNNRILISDTGNFRIRSLNITSGVVDTLIGNGTQAAQASQANPLQSTINIPRDVDIFKYAGLEYSLYIDNPNHLKAYNPYGDTQNVVGVDIDAGKTNTIAGTSTPSPQTWGGASLALFNNQHASVTPFWSPAGLGADGTNNTIYVSDWQDNCIKKIDGSGIISVFAGLCSNTTGNSGGLLVNARFSRPWDVEMDPLYPGNFFVIDDSQNSSTTSSLKYVNTSNTARSILGIVVNPYSVGNITLSTAMPFSNAIAVTVDHICVASGQFTVGSALTGNNSVFCYSRAGSGTLSLYVGNRNSPDLSTAGWFRGRMQPYMEDEGIGMGWGNGLDPYNLPVQLSGPQGLAFDDQGNLYISEFYGHTIRMVKRWYP